MYCRIHVEDPWSKSVSFLLQDTVELYLVFFLCYLVLVPLQVYAAMRQHHPVTRLFTASLILEFLALCLILLHVLKFSLDGSGFQQLAVAGDILDILSRVRN
jgi:Rhodopsin-like GPCR transmembrane domain.